MFYHLFLLLSIFRHFHLFTVTFWSDEGCSDLFPMYLRFGVSPSWWDSSGFTTFSFFVFYPNPFYYTFSSHFPWGCLDCKHSWLHSWKAVACYGCWLPHHSPHYISAQLWPLYHLDGLDVWDSSRPGGGRWQGKVMNCRLALNSHIGYLVWIVEMWFLACKAQMCSVFFWCASQGDFIC